MNDDLDYGELCKVLREEKKQRNARRWDSGSDEIMGLRGYEIEFRSGWSHFRINNRLDLYPKGRRYHDLRTQRRGSYGKAIDIVRKILGVPGAPEAKQ